MRTLFDRPFPVSVNHTAPENSLALVVSALEFEPGVVSVDRATGKEVANLFCAHNHIHSNSVASPQRGPYSVQWRGNGCGFDAAGGTNLRLSLFSHSKRGCEFRLRGCSCL